MSGEEFRHGFGMDALEVIRFSVGFCERVLVWMYEFEMLICLFVWKSSGLLHGFEVCLCVWKSSGLVVGVLHH